MVSRTTRENWAEYGSWFFLLLFLLLALMPTWWVRPLAYMSGGVTLGVLLAQKLLIDTRNAGQREMPRSGHARVFGTVLFWTLTGFAVLMLYQILTRTGR